MSDQTTGTLTRVDTLNIHSIETFGTCDGPGIRLVVFLQGCQFQCLYCANPDTMRSEDGKPCETSHIVETAENMRSFFANGGGVTLSGGEPCRQARKLIPLLRELRARGIHTCLDTNGYVMNKYVEEMLEYIDLVLLDVKHIDPVIHKRITGRSNENTMTFAHYLEEQHKPFWLRYVLVPGLTDNPEHLHRLGQHFQSFEQVQKLEIQPYHRLGVYKWEKLGMKYALENTPENTSEQLTAAKELFEQYLPEVVVN